MTRNGEAAPARPAWRAPLYVFIGTSFTFLVVVAGAIIGWHNYTQNRDLTITTTRDLFGALARQTRAELEAIQHPAELVVDLAAQQRLGLAKTLDERLGSAPFLITALEHAPALSALYAGLAGIATHPSEATSALLGTREIAQAHEALSNLATDMSLAALRYRSLLSQAERIRLSLVTLARLRHRLKRENAFHPAIAALDQYRQNAAYLLQAVAQSFRTGKEPGLEADRLVLGVALAQRLAVKIRRRLRHFRMQSCAT